MALDLEIVGPVRVLDGPTEKRTEVPTLKRLRDSHHAVARLFARGLTPWQISLQTGYAPSRISTLQNDPAFAELVEHYRRDGERATQEVEAQFLLVAKDAAQVLHERILDDGEEIGIAALTEIFKTFADRAGYAPVQRSVNKNLNLNLGERLDAARRKNEAA